MVDAAEATIIRACHNVSVQRIAQFIVPRLRKRNCTVTGPAVDVSAAIDAVATNATTALGINDDVIKNRSSSLRVQNSLSPMRHDSTVPPDTEKNLSSPQPVDPLELRPFPPLSDPPPPSEDTGAAIAAPLLLVPAQRSSNHVGSAAVCRFVGVKGRKKATNQNLRQKHNQSKTIKSHSVDRQRDIRLESCTSILLPNDGDEPEMSEHSASLCSRDRAQ